MSEELEEARKMFKYHEVNYQFEDFANRESNIGTTHLLYFIIKYLEQLEQLEHEREAKQCQKN